MKIIASIIFVLLPVVAAAQNYQGMSEAEMQGMMQKAQEMQVCMEKVDQAQLKVLEQRSNEIDAELKSLCAQGKRDQAQKKAIAYGKEMVNNPALKQMQKCSEIMKGVLPQTERSFMDDDMDFSKHHVCDQ